MIVEALDLQYLSEAAHAVSRAVVEWAGQIVSSA
jgi:hypothetical protein